PASSTPTISPLSLHDALPISLVRHRDYIRVVEMFPIAVATLLSFGRRRRKRRIAVEPLLDDVVVKLLRPEESGERLSHHIARVLDRKSTRLNSSHDQISYAVF